MIKVTKNRHPRIAHEVAVLLLCCGSDKLQATLVGLTWYFIIDASLNSYSSAASLPAHGLLADRSIPCLGQDAFTILDYLNT